MPLETRAHARRAEQRRLGELRDGISNPEVLGQILDRLPGAESWLTVGRLGKAWRERAAPKRAAAQQAALAAPRGLWYDWDHDGAPLPLWYVEEQWPRLAEARRANTAARAARHGDVRALQWIGGPLQASVSRYCIEQAAAYGHLEVLQWLRQQEPLSSWVADACSTAAACGHLEVLKWLRQQEPPCPLDKYSCTAAAREGHLEVLKWLRQQEPMCPWGEETCNAAAEEGQLEVLQWLRQQEPACPWGEETCTAATEGGHLEVLQWLRKPKPGCRRCPWDAQDVLSTATEMGHTHIVEWLDAGGGRRRPKKRR